MNEQTKESKFLDAINRYAEQQKAQITREIEEYKNNKIEQATEQGLQDAYDLIRDDIAKRKNAIVKEVAGEELRLRRELYTRRQEIRDSVFREAEQKLRDFARGEDYLAFLRRSLDEALKTVGDRECAVYLAPFDEDKRGLITEKLPRAQVLTDSHILIGGIKVYCPGLNIVLDDTIDTRLFDQQVWFSEHSGLKVV